MGSVCYTVMVRLHSLNIHTLFHLHHPSQISLGEMIVYFPIPGGHITLAERFVDPAFSFAMGWNYWYGTCLSRVSAQLTLDFPPGITGLLHCLWNLVLPWF